ncbi:MAG: hypothetical protein Q9167_005411 [Letrouitia subvulpina]
MFGTLHCKSHTEVEFVERPHGSSDLEKNSACDRCKAKKVKCINNYDANDGCSRCKQLGKKCTISSTKRGDNHRKRKADANIAQQERFLDFLIQSPVPSRSKEITPEKRLYSEKPFLTSSLPTDRNNDDGEPGHQVVTGNSTDKLDHISPTFLDGLDQQSGRPDGDSMFHLCLSPPPDLSTIFPSRHPEPTAAWTSGSLPTLPLSSEDKVPDYFSLPGQSHHSSFFDLNPNTTPMSLDASTSTSAPSPFQSSSGQSCRCLAAVIFAVEKLEASCKSGDRSELDTIVAQKKAAIQCCRSMLKCSSCMAERQNLVLLVFMSEKIVAACGRIVVLYCANDRDTRAGSVLSPLPGHSPTESLSHFDNVEDRDLLTSTSSASPRANCRHTSSIMLVRTGTSSDWQELLVGNYEINSSLEWEHVVRLLLFLQLNAAVELLADLKKIGSELLGETQIASLAQAETKVSQLRICMHRRDIDTGTVQGLPN